MKTLVLASLQSLLLLLLLPMESSNALQDETTYNVPAFSLEELNVGSRSEDLLRALRSTGILSVQLPQSHLGGPFEFEGLHESIHRSVAMNGLCHCLENVASMIPQVEGVDSILLADQNTRRATIATATVGNSPLPLASRESLDEYCGQGTVEAMEFLRDQVAMVSDTFVQSLDRLHMYYHDNSSPLLRDNQGGSYSTIKSIVQSANHLEHFHLYSKDGDRDFSNGGTWVDETLSLEWHTDAGLFLAFVPGWDCHSSGAQSDTSFWVQLPGGEKARAVFEPNSVVIMMGAGAEHWLRNSFDLKATRHAVHMNGGDARTWYGMMHLVPDNAIIQESPRAQTFGEMKENMRLVAERQLVYGQVNPSDSLGVAIGCGPSFDDHPIVEDAPEVDMFASLPMRRRLQHVADASACNNATNFFCWMQCLEIPNYKKAESYINEGDSLYCLDPGILARTGNSVAKAMEPCTGKVHNSNCMGVWHPTAPGIPGQKVIYNSTVPDNDGVYCYGGTSMYMDGFHWIHETTCVIYLFPSWVLSTQGKFVAACLGTVLFGMLIEYVISRRRDSMTSMPGGYRRLVASATFYGLQLSMGYLVMLVVMTYSIPLFLCCVLGLVGGHVLFNAKDAIVSKNAGNTYETSSGTRYRKADTQSACDANVGAEETARQATESVSTTMPACCCSAEKQDDDIVDDVPEGITPCCQNVL